MTSLTSWLDRELDRAGAVPNPGRPLLHRLNRAEYGNVIRDLLALDVDVAVAAAARRLGVRLRQQRRSARRLARRCSSGTSPPRIASARWPSATVDDRQARRPTTHAAISRRASSSKACRSARSAASACATPFRSTASTSSHVDADRARTSRRFAGSSTRTSSRSPSTASACSSPPSAARTEAGQTGAITDEIGRHRRAAARARAGQGGPAAGGGHVHPQDCREHRTACGRSSAATPAPTTPPGGRTSKTLTITGPFDPTGPGDTPSRRRIFICRPATLAAGERGARGDAARAEILTTLARRAYRRPVGDADVAPLLHVLPRGPAEGHLRDGHAAGLAPPAGEPDVRVPGRRGSGDDSPPGAPYRVSDVELASRLSFFLWSSMPDDALLDLAAAKRLHEPAVLEAQVRRMLADPKRRRASWRTSPGSGCTSATSRTSRPTPTSSRTSTTTCARRSGARPSCSSAASCARTATCSTC